MPGEDEATDADPSRGPRRSWPERLRPHLGPLALYVVLTTWLFWPIIRHPTGRFVGTPAGDSGVFLWFWWWFDRSVSNGHDPLHTTSMFYPQGADLTLHTTVPLETVLLWPVGRLFGIVAEANVNQLSAVLLSAVAAYFLALRVCGDRRAAAVAGLAFAFAPFRFVHAVSGHQNLIHAELLPFGLLALLRLVERPSRGRAVALGAVVAAVFYTDVYYTFFLALALAVVLVAKRSEVDWTRLRRRLVEAGIAAAVLCAPFVVLAAGALRRGGLGEAKGWGLADVYSADLLSWVTPAATHPLWGGLFESVQSHLSADSEGVIYPGLVILLVALLGRRLGDERRRRGWVALAVVGAVLSFGPFLRVNAFTGDLFHLRGTAFSLPLPYMAMAYVPVLNGIRSPARFALLTMLALDVLVAIALASWRRQRHRWGTVLPFVVGLLTLVEFLPGTLPTVPAAVPAPYHAIAAEPGDGAVLEVPLQWFSAYKAYGDVKLKRSDQIFLYYATVHGKPLVSGVASRYPSADLDRLAAMPVFNQILAMQGEEGFDAAPVFTAADLRAAGIGYVVEHRDRFFPTVHDHLVRLGLPILADDGTVLVWKVPPSG